MDEINQDEINKSEWGNSENWSGGVLGVYFSKKDSRIWVPKSIPWMGWTLNLGRDAGVWLFTLLLLSPAIILALVIIFTNK